MLPTPGWRPRRDRSLRLSPEFFPRVLAAGRGIGSGRAWPEFVVANSQVPTTPGATWAASLSTGGRSREVGPWVVVLECA